jgi:predicted O-methyltransferase YrrM
MTSERWHEVDRYISDLHVGPDMALEAALADSAAAGLPAINVAPNQGKFLMLLARAIRALKILEIGTLGAYSAIWLARGLPPDGCLITLEADSSFARVAQSNIARAGLADVVEIRVGRALETLPQLEAEGEGPFDLVFIDADKASYPEYLEWSLRLSRPGTVIVADNVVRDGEVVNASSDDLNVQGVRRFNEMLAAEPRLDATAIQTVGIKGYDGFAIVLVNGRK